MERCEVGKADEQCTDDKSNAGNAGNAGNAAAHGFSELGQVIDALCATLPVDPEKLEAVKLWSQWDLEGTPDFFSLFVFLGTSLGLQRSLMLIVSNHVKPESKGGLLHVALALDSCRNFFQF